MKNNKIIYIAILILSAIIAYYGGFNYFNHSTDNTKTDNNDMLNQPEITVQTAETRLQQILPTPPQPDYSFTLRAAGISSQMPVYSIYNIALYGDTPAISKINECLLGFKVIRIIHLKNKKNTLLLNETRDALYIFNESNDKIENRVISFAAALDATPKDTITAIAINKDEKLIAAALEKSGTIQIIRADNFEHLLSIADKSAGLNKTKSLDFDANNNLYITTVDNLNNSTTLYQCRANLSYSKLEKISWFSLPADSSLFDHANGLYIYYNRNSGTVFKINFHNNQSGIIMNNPPQLSEKQTADNTKPSQSQLIKVANACALVRNDNKTIKIFNAVTGVSTHEIKLNSAPGTEITGGGNEKYVVITSADDGIIRLINRTALKLINATRLEGINNITCLESE